MSQVYNTLPPTTGKVILTTNFGNIDIELFCKECPKATKNFIQLCLEGYYNNREFHRIINDFIIQCGGDEETTLGKEFKDEFHSRIKFKTRGMVACVNKSKPNSNTNQFFITVSACQWLDNKNTIFGKVAGESFFNVKAINEIPSSKDGEPQLEKDSRPRVIKADVIVNPFDDILIRNNCNNKLIDNQNASTNTSTNNCVVVDKFNLEEKKIINDSNLLSFQDELEISNYNNNQDKVNNETNTFLKKKNKNTEINNLNFSNNNSLNNNNNNNNNLNKSICQNNTHELESSYKVIKQPKLSKESNSNYNLNSIKFDINEEINKINKQDLLSSNLKLIEQEEMDGMTALEKYRKTVLNKANYTTVTSKKSEKMAKLQLDNLKNKLKLLKKDGERGENINSKEWISNKLKFHIDSEKAYSLQKIKEQIDDGFIN